MAKHAIERIYIRRSVYFCALFFSPSIFLFVCGAESSPLQHTVSVDADNVTVEETLELLEKQTNLTFSYNPEQFPIDSTLSLHAQNVSVEQVLRSTLGSNTTYRTIGNIVILRTELPDRHAKKKNVSVAGAITDKKSGKKIENATVLLLDSKYAAQTASTGGFDLAISSKDQYMELYISKKNYRDTVLHIPADKAIAIDVALEPIGADEVQLRNSIDPQNSIEKLSIVKLSVPEKQSTFRENVKQYTANMDAQISVVPFIGTNMLTNSVTKNKISFNLFAGYSGGVEGFELGSLVNIVHDDVNGAQIGGFANVVGGSVSGLQMGGVGNNSRKNISGVQVAGTYNIVLDSIRGMQVAGYFNLAHGQTRGMQLCGFANTSSGVVRGMQLSGFANVGLDTVRGVQFSGFANYGKTNIRGSQVSGYANIAKNVKGAQIAGFSNVALEKTQGMQLSSCFNFSGKDHRGTQISGFSNLALGNCTSMRLAGVSNLGIGDFFAGADVAGLFNYAKKDMDGLQTSSIMNFVGGQLCGLQISVLGNYAQDAKGVQVSCANNKTSKLQGMQVGMLNLADTVNGVQFGIINIADTVHGASIGLLPIVHNGYRAIAIEGGDVFLPRVSFRLGANSFYSIFSMSFASIADTVSFGFGYGVGSRHMIGEKRKMYVAVETSATVLQKYENQDENNLNIYYDFSFSFGRKLGRHLELFAGPQVYLHSYSQPYLHTSHIGVVYSKNESNRIVDFWVGYRLGISLW